MEMKPVRRKEFALFDFDEIVDILRRSDVIRLGLSGREFPYIVPLSFGFEAEKGQITIFFHGAKVGFKHELIAENSNVCVESDIFNGYAEVPHGITAEYESFIGFGRAETVSGKEAERGIELLLSHCGFSGYDCDSAALQATGVYKIVLDSFSAKRRPVKKIQEDLSMPLDTVTAINSRYSCREFSDKMPSDKELDIIAKAAAASPSGMNRQLWRVIVVKKKSLISELEAEGMKNLAAMPDKSMHERIMQRGGKLFYNAPCMMVVPVAKAFPAGAELFDCGIVAENIALAAASLGVDNLICGFSAFSFAGNRADYFKAELGFPEGYEIGIAVLLGHAETPGGKPHEPDLNKISWIE